MPASLALLERPGLEPSPAAALPVVVMKFGSSVLVDPADAPKAASDIYAEVRRGRRVVAVVSALAGETDRLAEGRALGLAHDNALLPAYAVQGEERSAALVALACDRVGLSAATLSVRELGLVAEGPCEHARPVALDRAALEDALRKHEVVVVPGFGALSPEGLVVLLGRGGSDLSALFLAAGLELDGVQLVKDVDGLYDRDPNAFPDARRYDQASWAEARAIGGGLVQPDALDFAEARGLKVEVRNYLDGHRTVVGAVSAPPRAPRPHRRLRVAVAGCGVVGGGALARLLVDPRVEVVGVLVRDVARSRDVPGAAPGRLEPLLVTDAQALLDRRPDIVLEALSEAGAGHALIRAALERGADVATANKQAVSLDPAGLQALARAHGARLLWSASVGGGAPMIEAVRDARALGPVAAFEAVLNGTVNFMLDRLGDGASFDRALAEARAAGFAEEDPSSDLEGLDALAKVRLLAFEAFGHTPDEADIPRDVLETTGPPAVRAGGRPTPRGGRRPGVPPALSLDSLTCTPNRRTYPSHFRSTEAAMLTFKDQVSALDERSTERMNFRTKPRIKQTIQRAAALAGVDDSVFTMNAAYESALNTIAAHERTVLAPLDHAAFFAAMDAPPAPTDKLRAAFARHRETVASR